jgi:suppressor of G2 allele of SKP1
MNDLFSKANELFVDEKYEEAEKLYSQVISKDPKNAKAYLKRSATLLKLNQIGGFCCFIIFELFKILLFRIFFQFSNFYNPIFHLCITEAISDADMAVNIDPTNATAYMRRGFIFFFRYYFIFFCDDVFFPLFFFFSMALFSSKEFEKSKQDFKKGSDIEPENSTFKTWIRKCESELQSSVPQTQSTDSLPHTQSTNIHQQPSAIPQLTSQPTQQTTSQLTQHSIPPSIAIGKVRHEWYQTSNEVIVTVFSKNVKSHDLQVNFDTRKVSFIVENVFVFVNTL